MPKRKQDQDGLYRRGDSPYWWVSFTDASGARTRRSTGTTDRREAEALLAKWKLEVHQQRFWEQPPARTFDELMLAYTRETAGTKRSAERDRHSLKQLYPVFSGCDLTTLTAAEVRAYIVQRQAAGAAPATINREVGLLSAALNRARREWDWDIPNLAAGRKLRPPEGRSRWLSRAEAVALLQAAEREPKAPHLGDFIRMALHTGMRTGELLGLEWRRVDLQVNLIYLEAAHQKSGKVGSVPLNNEARAALIARAKYRAEHCPDSPWVFCGPDGQRIASIKRSFATACRRAGLSDVHPHDLRRTCGSWAVQAGASLQEVAALLRHSDIRVTHSVYAHLAPDSVRATVDRLETGASRSSHASITPPWKQSG